MKITISAYEGQAEFQSYSAEMHDDCDLSDFIDRLEAVVRAFYGSHVTLGVHTEDDHG